MGPKDLATPAHLISSPRPTPRKKKRPRMNKKGPNCWETSQTKVTEGESGTPSKTVLPRVPNKRTNTVGQL